MKLDSEEWRRLRSQFIEAAANYENAGYRTFIERTVRVEEYYLNHRYDRVAEIKWPYRPWRTCWILAPSSGTNEQPFAVMKTLFTKAWLRLPIVVAGRIVDTAVWQLSPRDDVGLLWARSHYELWCWLLWFDWLWRCREVETEEPEFPPAGMDLKPFSSSVGLIDRWGLDGGDGTLPEWLAQPLPLDAEVAQGRRDQKRRGRKKADYETVQKEAAFAAEWGRARDAGTSKGDFAKDKKLSVQQLDRLLDRVAKRKAASE